MHNHQIMAMLHLDAAWPSADEVPWCSAFVNYVCWLYGTERTENLRARSWLLVGRKIELHDAVVGFDIVILKRGGEDQPGPEVINAQGHVGFFVGADKDFVSVHGGNQSDSVNISRYPISQILGIRRVE
jgi:uncharacterized protein (TIGR02594 family)